MKDIGLESWDMSLSNRERTRLSNKSFISLGQVQLPRSLSCTRSFDGKDLSLGYVCKWRRIYSIYSMKENVLVHRVEGT